MLPCAGLCNDALLAHAAGKQALTKRIVDLVRAGVQQVFPFQINLRAAQCLAQPLREVERCGPAAVVVQQVVELGMERRVGISCGIGLLQLFQRGHQRLRYVAAAVGAETARARGMSWARR